MPPQHTILSVEAGRDDTTKVLARLAGFAVVVVLAMAAAVAWSQWNDARQRAQVVLRSYAGFFADNVRADFTLQAHRLGHVGDDLVASPPGTAIHVLRRARATWFRGSGLMLLDGDGRVLTRVGPVRVDPADVREPTRIAWAGCKPQMNDCLLPPIPDPRHPGELLAGQAHRLPEASGTARWLVLVRAPAAPDWVRGLDGAYPSAVIAVLRNDDGLLQTRRPMRADLLGRPLRIVGLARTRGGSGGTGFAGDIDPDALAMVGAYVPVPGLPYTVFAALPRRVLLGQWARHLLPYAAAMALIVAIGAVLLLVGARKLGAAQRAQRDAKHRLERASAFQAFRAGINELINDTDDEATLMQGVCAAASALPAIGLAWIGRTHSQGRAEVLASAGATAYLSDALISNDPHIPEGRGPFGLAWRSGAAQFNADFADAATPWAARARQHDLRSSAALPILRHGRVDAILSLYWREEVEFDAAYRRLLTDATADLGRGLERLDLLRAQQEALRARERQGELMRTVFSQIDVLIAARSEIDVLETACKRLLEGGLFVAAWIGRPDVTGAVEVAAAAGEAATMLEAHPSHLARQPLGAFARAWNSEHKAIETDPESPLLKPWAAYAFPGARQEAVTLPIRRSDQLWGVLVLVANDGADLDEIVQATLLRTAELIGQALTEIDLKQLLQTRESEQAHLARHDALTGLANRLALEQHLPHAIARARRAGHQLAVGVLDLDDFKPVNDTWGHAAGDRLLQQLATRLEGQLRESDLLARLGGDEFVLVLDDLDGMHARALLESILARMHRAVETPFILAEDVQAEVGMSMGLALFPNDGDEADQLLRQADVALYAAKAGKSRRQRWWLLSGEQSDSTEEESIEPYGAAAAALLLQADLDLGPIEDGFIEELYRRLTSEPQSARILAMLTPEELSHLRDHQRQHLRRLLDPDLSRQAHEDRCFRLGRIHATIGVDGAAVMAAMSEYSAALHRAIQGLRLRLEARVKLQSVIQARLSGELQATQRGGLEVERERHAHSAMMEMKLDDWEASGQLPRHVVEHLASLPGICGVACGRPDVDNHYVLEFAAGIAARYYQDMRDVGVDLDFERVVAEHVGPTQRAWSTGQIATEPNECRTVQFGPLARRVGVRSVAALPLLDRSGHAHQVITLLGTLPGQFDATSMRLWLESVQHQLNPAFQRVLAGQIQPIAATRRSHLHELLFGGGLHMYVQPLVNMASGDADMVEALARLQDGTYVLSPGEFLEAFGNHELRILFRKGLEQTLQWVRTWEAQGLHVSASVNLPPSVLLEPECAQWVAQALADSGVPAHRLYLELLETHEDMLDSARRDAAIADLSRIGVRLVMDDLGSGYSSLKRMRSLPFHTVKIDQQIVLQAQEDPLKTIAFIGALVRMAQGLGMRVTMEGLEAPGLVEMAMSLGVEHGQGYAMARPMPAEAFADWQSRWRLNLDAARPSTVLGRQALLFSRDVAPLDWQRMIASHQEYRDTLARNLRGDGIPLQWALVQRDDACLLGRWMKRQALTIWPEARPLFEKAQTLHTTFHHEAGELLRRAQEDGEVDAVLTEIAEGDLDRCSERLVRALHQLSWIMSADGGLPVAGVSASASAASLPRQHAESNAH